MFGRYVSFILCGIVEHMHDEEAQKAVFVMLRHFVGEEAAKKMAAYAEMRYCQDTKYAIAAEIDSRLSSRRRRDFDS
jgi:hypothetical protein